VWGLLGCKKATTARPSSGAVFQPDPSKVVRSADINRPAARSPCPARTPRAAPAARRGL